MLLLVRVVAVITKDHQVIPAIKVGVMKDRLVIKAVAIKAIFYGGVIVRKEQRR